MRDDFEITIPEIDTLVEIINDALPIVGGARMTGGGFGGCVIALVPKSEVSRVAKVVTKKYPQIVNIQPTIYNFTVENGAFNFNNHKVQEAL
jgi:galactokinase